MPEFNEWDNPPNGTAPPDADVFDPPGNTLAQQESFCRLHMHDAVFGMKCVVWLRDNGFIQ